MPNPITISSNSFLSLEGAISSHIASKSGVSSTKRKGDSLSSSSKRKKLDDSYGTKNKGVAERSHRDRELRIESSQKAKERGWKEGLERKSKKYEQLKKGKTAGLTPGQRSELLVDFENSDGGDNSSSSEDEETNNDKDEDNPDEEMVTYEDEFGRERTVRKSELPRKYEESESNSLKPNEVNESNVHYGAQTYFPVFEDQVRIERLQSKIEEASGPKHYDASFEIRTRGAGFKTFSNDEEERKRQMEELKNMRSETEKEREIEKVTRMDVEKEKKREMLLERRKRMRERVKEFDEKIALETSR